MHYADPVSAGERQRHEHDLRRSAEFHAVLLAMAVAMFVNTCR
jgi:hypothetical protein